MLIILILSDMPIPGYGYPGKLTAYSIDTSFSALEPLLASLTDTYFDRDLLQIISIILIDAYYSAGVS